MQITFTDAELVSKKKQTRRDPLLMDLENLVPWSVLESVIEPYYPKSHGKRGRPTMGISRMSRMYILQQVMGIYDKRTEVAVYDSAAIQLFMGIDLGRDAVPDATTLLRFRRLLETHDLTQQVFATVNYQLASKGLYLTKGTLVDATIIAAPPSTKNKSKSHDPEMRSTKKGNQYYFCMKAHIGADAASGLVHTLVSSAANVHDVKQAHALLHGEEQQVYGGPGYLRADKIEKLKNRIRAKVEYPFYWIKVHFGHGKTRYRGLAKTQHISIACLPWQPVFVEAMYAIGGIRVFLSKKQV